MVRKCKLKEVGFQEKRVDEVESTQFLYDAVTYPIRHLNETSDICERLQVKLVSTEIALKLLLKNEVFLKNHSSCLSFGTQKWTQ